MNNEQWRIYIRNLGDPGSEDKKTRLVRRGYDAARATADFLNRRMAREHGDGVYHAYIVSEQATEAVFLPAPAPPLYRLYDDIGRYKGTYNEEAAQRKLSINEQWTMVEIK